ncbi:MAG: sulfite exporter TauE/SafE family protein [Timaviella obliquedivisa GSE-PSE-MK23-08B]|jgi:hypothetical protein|nr:sulfite exporter TauE/SafE family protein [Timaviella obliquedivisa GSE-PSE-MK23-08B]
MLDLFLLFVLGFLGSFGHCAGMCGPIAAAFSLSQQRENSVGRSLAGISKRSLLFHLLLNLGRLLSYALIGAGIGALGSVLIAGGQVAGVGSLLRRVMALLTGSLLIWFGLTQVSPEILPRLPFLHPLLQGKLHERLSSAMVKISFGDRWWTPFFLGAIWGLIPCGFLYTAQIKAAGAGSAGAGGLTMLAFGLGTVPTMLLVGISTGMLSRDRRSQLFRMGGWVTLMIGVLTLLRSADTMVDYTGHAAIVCLMLALVARPVSRLWIFLLRYRRSLGVGAFILSIAHMFHMVVHSWNWQVEKLFFMLPQHQQGIVMGGIALLLMLPLAVTSFDGAQTWLGRGWRSLHLLSIPALILGVMHTILVGSHYLGALQLSDFNRGATVMLGAIGVMVLLIRYRWMWLLLGLEKFYVSPIQNQRVQSDLVEAEGVGSKK